VTAYEVGLPVVSDIILWRHLLLFLNTISAVLHPSVLHSLAQGKRDDWNASRICLSHARSMQNSPSLTVMK